MHYVPCCWSYKEYSGLIAQFITESLQKQERLLSMTELIKVCNVNQYVSAYKYVWTDFYNWNTFLTKIFKAKLDTIKKYQLCESCYKNAGTIQC